MRILFAGTAEIATPTLKALYEKFEVGLVLTNPDARKGRSKELVASPVKKMALSLNIPVLQPERLRGQALVDVASYNCDVLVCFAYGKIFGPRFLSMFEKGAYNIHPSALPLLRGSAPIQYAILNGLDSTGITIQKLSLGVDEGDVCSVFRFDLDGSETTSSLSEKVSLLSAPLAIETFTKLENNILSSHPQEGEVSYTDMLSKDDSLLDFNEDAKVLHSKIRAFYPWPKAHTIYDGKVLFITGVNPLTHERREHSIKVGTVVEIRKKQGLVIACKDELLIVTALQLAGKKELDYNSFFNGNSKIIDSILGK
ncbi:MAG: methionyl-tRNA formyltransferase [Spirochaetaceae bacterium]|nr:methionyl-tRNA formyltransferase [Spirochaetaceae bacterium]